MINLALMKRILFLSASIFFLLVACTNSMKNYTAAENGLDASREFIDACLKGDFLKANFHLLADQQNTALLKTTEAEYREKDKEGRQQLRTASINIKEVTEPNDSIVILQYSNSLDTITHKSVVVKRNNQWLVDYKQSFQ
jgi:hypothetical protein